MDVFLKRLANLLSVKSLISMLLTIVFCVITMRGLVSAELFMTIFATVIAFYFGTQTTKDNLNKDEYRKPLALSAARGIFYFSNIIDISALLLYTISEKTIVYTF